MAFNPDEYFNRRVQQEMDADRLRGHSTRFEELQAASREKALLLGKAAERSRARIAEDESSLVSTLGLNPDGTVGEIVNLAASGLAGFSQHLIGNMAALPSDILASVGTIGIDDEDRAAYSRYKQNKATPEDMARLARKEIEGKADSITVADKLATEEQQRAVARNIRDVFNIDYLKHDDNANELNDQLGESFQRDWSTVKTGWNSLTGEDTLDGLEDLSRGLGGLLINAVDAGIDNPMAVSEYVMQNAPQLAMGASRGAQLALGATNVSYAYDNYTKGIEQYQQANDGMYPPENVRREIAAWAASLALAEQVGDAAALKTVFGGAKKAATEVATEVAKKGVGQAVLRTAKAGAVGVGTEAATEGYQTFAESQTGANGYMKDPVTDKYLRDKDGNLIAKTASAEDIYKGATIGGLTGGGLSAGGRAIGESAQLVADGLDTLKDLKVPEGRVIPGQKEVIDQVAETGDATPLLDKASPMYAPEKAVAALQSWATKVNTPEAWAKAGDVAQSTLEALENERTAARMFLENTSPEGKQTLEKSLALAKEIQSKMAEQNSPDLQEQTAYVAELEAELAAATNPDASDLKLMQKRAAQLDTRIASVTQAFEGIAQRKSLAAESATVPETAALEGTEVESSAAEVAPPATSAPETTLTLSMRAPQQVTPESAEALANDTTNELVPEQRTYLKSFAAARKAEADLERVYEDNKDIFEVNQEVLYGSDKNMGLPQHRRAILAALNSGSPRKLAYARTLFAKFQQSHADKLNRPNPRSKNGEHTVAFTNVIKSEQAAMAALAAEMDALIAARKATSKTAAPAAKTTPAATTPTAPAPVATPPVTAPTAPVTPAAPATTAAEASPIAPAIAQEVTDNAFREWYFDNRTSMQSELTAGGIEDGQHYTRLPETLQSRSAHGMAKNLGDAVANLRSLLQNGIDPNRGRNRGTLDTAPLARPAGSASGSGTGSGTAYSDGAFTLVAREGVGAITDIGQVEAVVVNSALPQGVVDGLRAEFPGLKVGYASEIGQLLSKDNADPATVSPETVTAPAAEEDGAVAPTKKPVDQLTADDWSAIIGYIDGPVRPDGPHESIDTDTFLLLKNMVIKIIKDGVKNGTPRERIIQQIEGVTKGGVKNNAMNNIHLLLNAQTVNASAPAAPATTPTTTPAAAATSTPTAQAPVTSKSKTPEFDKLPAHVPGQKTMTYAGIGSRKVPAEVARKMEQIATWLAKKGYTLQSGHAAGADIAFEKGADGKAEIFTVKDATDTTRTIAREIHPNPGALTEFPLNLMARNTNQVFGANLDSPVDFVLTWTPDGAETSAERTQATGGTGQAIDMASRKGIPVINMAKEGWQDKLREALAIKAEEAPIASPAPTAPVVKATPLPTPIPKKDPVKARVSRAVNEAKDTMLEVLVKIGGLDPVDAKANGVDPVHFDAQEEGLGMVFFEGGSTIEKAAASMTDLGYLLPNENGEADIDAFMEALNTSLEGTPVYTSEGYQAAALAEEQARIEEDREFDNGLEVMREKTTEDSPYQSRNFLADFFKQIGGRKTDATRRPLVMVKDFLTKYLAGTLDLIPFLGEIKLTSKQETALATFMQAAKAWQKDIQDNLPVRVAEDKRLYDLMQYFLQDTDSGAVDIEENLKTAIAYGAYSAMLDLANKPRFSTQETMNKQLGRPKTARMSHASKAELETAGEYLQLLRNSIGQRIVDALGLKASKDAPKDVDAKLVEVLGAHGLKLLEEIKLSDGKVGLIQRTAISGARMAQMRMENLTESEIAKLQALEADITGKNKGEYVTHYFFSITRNEKGALHPDVAALVEKNRGTQGILDKLFKVTGAKTTPLLAPSSKVQKKASGTDMGVPGKLREILLENQKHPRTLRTDLWGFLKHLEETNTEVFEQMLGIESIDERTTHVRDIKAIQAKNDGLRQEWEMLNEFVEETLINSPDGFNTKFFLEFDVWKQHRVGIATSAVNPQTSKIVRFLIGSPDWEQTIESNNDEHMASFWLRVAEGLGVKTEQISNEKAIANIKAMFIRGTEENAPVPPYAAAVEALIKAIALKDEAEELSPDEQNAIAEIVGDKRIHALDALTAVAYQQLAERRAAEQAVASGSKDTSYSFTTRMIGEVDGVANGTMLNHILYGAAGDSSLLNVFLEMGGIYTLVEAKARFTNYNLYKAASTGHLDIYQTLAKKVFKAVQDSIRPEDGGAWDRVNSVWALTGEIFSEEKDAATSAGRNLMKEGVNPLAFGSALDRVKANMAQAAVDGVYKQFSKLAKQVPEATNAEVQALVAHINTLISRRNIALPVGKDLDWYMKHELTEEQEAAIRDSFAEVVGDTAGEVLADQFKHFIDRRTKMTETTNLTAKLYNAMYTGVRKAFVQELIDTGVLPVSAKGNPLRDLTFAEEAEFMSRVAAAMPQLNTYFSKLDPAGSQTGLRPVKTQRKQSLEIQYSSDVRFGRPVKKTGTKYMSIHGMKKFWAEPGVAMVSAMTHAHDSVISHLTQLKMDVLNIHDAVATGVLSLKDAAKLMNQNTWEVMLATSPLEESFLALERMVVAMAEMAKNGTLTQDAINNISTMLATDKNLKKYKAKDAIKLMLMTAKHEAAKADKIKLEAMTTWAVVDQYAYEGGQYDVTPEDRAAAQTLLTKVTEDLSPATTEALEVLSEALAGPKKATPQKPVKVSTAPELEGATTPEASVPSVDSSDSNPDADANGESSLDEDLTVLKNGLDRKSFIQMANVFARGIKNTKLSEEARAMLREWAVLLEQGKLVWEGVERKIQELGGTLEDDVRAILEQTFDTDTMFGEQGIPAILPNPNLVQLFQENETPSLKQVLHTLMTVYRGQPNTRMTKFNMELLMQLAKVLPDTLTFQVITPTTDPKELRTIPVAESYGWFSANSNGQTIYVMGPEFVASNLNPDMLLHELVHGALAQLIADELAKKAANPAYTSDALALVEELDRLRLKAVKFAQGNQKLSDTYAAALADVQEFVAWGLAHQGFQREVLTKISMTPQTSKNRLVTGMSDFIKLVTQLLFKGSDKSRQKIAVSGMTLMISNTSGLFAAVAEQVKTQQGQIELLMATPTSSTTVQAYSTQDVLSALLAQNPPQNPGFAAHLESVLSDMVTRLHGPFGSLKAALSQGVTGAPIDRWIKALDSGQAPFASLVRKAPFAVSDAELFMIEQVEVTVRDALEGDTENQGSFAASELRRLFVEMRDNLIKGQDLTKEQHDFLFRIEGNGQTTSDYLSRFAAMVLAHEEVRNLAVVATNRSQSRSLQAPKMGIGDRVQRWFLKVLQFFSSQFAGTRMNSPGNIRMRALVQRLVDIEAQRKHLLKHPMQDFLEGPAKVAEKAMEQGRKAVTAIVDSNWVQNKAFLPIRVVGKAASIVVNDRLQSSAQGLLHIRDKALASKHGLAASLATELVGHKEKLLAIMRHSKVLENLRKDVITGRAKAALEAFADGKAMSKNQKHALTQVFLRSGAHVLLSRYSVIDITNMVGDPVALDNAIAQLEAEAMRLGGSNYGHYFRQQALFSGYAQVTGRVVTPHFMMNAHNIAAMFGTLQHEDDTGSLRAQAEPVIAALIALNAIKYAPPAQKDMAVAIARKELQRNGENGIEFLLRTHAQLEHESRQTSFKGKEALMVHGFVPDINNPYTETKIAPRSERANLELQSWTYAYDITPSPGESVAAPEAMYVMRGAGLQPWMSGFIEIHSQAAKGTLLVEGGKVTKNPAMTASHAMSAVASARVRQVQSLFRDLGKIDPTKMSQEYSAPLLNAQGKIVNYRHLMHETTKDTLLGRDSGFDQVLGALAGSVFDKEELPKHNDLAIKALHDLYEEENKYNPDGFILVGPRSPDVEMRERWKLLSPEARATAIKLFGKEGMRVPKNAVDLALGFRKKSLGDIFAEDIFTGDASARKWYEKLITVPVEWMLATYARQRLHMNELEVEQYIKRARVLVTKGDRMWQEIVREIKDIVVVKTGLTLLGNMTSNWLQLWAEGLSWKEIFQYSQIALRGALEYRQDSQKLMRLEDQMSSGYLGTDAAEVQSEINRLRDKIQRNPVHADIEAGLMPSVVEDVQEDNDPYSYKSALTEWVQGNLAKLGKKGSPIRETARWAYMTKDTWMYQGLSRMTQLSDFTARHALKQHLMHRKTNPLSKDDAVARASSAFINYDVPLHPILQALDDRGLLLFTKYIIRIQPVLLRLFREKPLRMIMMMVANGWVDTGPIITDSAIVSRLGNPLEAGAFGIFDVLNETATVAGAIALID